MSSKTPVKGGTPPKGLEPIGPIIRRTMAQVEKAALENQSLAECTLGRLQALDDFLKGYHGSRLLKKLRAPEVQAVRDFVRVNAELSHSAFTLAVHSWMLGVGQKFKNWAIMSEILESANTRHRYLLLGVR